MDWADDMARIALASATSSVDMRKRVAHEIRVAHVNEMRRCADIADRVGSDKGYDEDVRTAAIMIRNMILAHSIVPPSKALDDLMKHES